MALFFDQTAQQPQTHVLIIGIGGYPYLYGGTKEQQQTFDGSQLLGQLSSPPLSAEAFFDTVMELHSKNCWVRPLGSVDVLVSPNPSEPAPFAGRLLEAATIKNIKTAYWKWKARCDTHSGNAAIFFFCGHGLEKGDQYLLAEDFGELPQNPWEGSFAFDLTRRAFFSCKASAQLFFVDACRVITPDMLQTNLPLNPIDNPSLLSKDCAFNLTQKAAAVNESAYGSKGQPSFYTKALTGALKGNAVNNDSGEWMVNTNSLSAKIEELLKREAPGEAYPQRCDNRTNNSTDIIRFAGPPQVPLTITCLPEMALPHAELSYLNLNTFQGETRKPDKGSWDVKVDAGIYMISARFDKNSYQSQSISKAVMPPSVSQQLNCVPDIQPETVTQQTNTSTASPQPGTLQVIMDSHFSESMAIPKQLQVLGTDMTLKQSDWVTSGSWQQQFIPGVYMIRVNLPSGKQLEGIADIAEGKETSLNFDLGQFSPRETQEWMYLTKSNSGENPVSFSFRGSRSAESKKFLDGISARRWFLYNGEWSSLDEPGIMNQFIDEIGESYLVYAYPTMNVLELLIPGEPSSFVCMPPWEYSNNLKCMIKIAEGPETAAPVLDVSLSIPNNTVQALLSLLTVGDMEKAKTLHMNWSEFEQPAAAAIAGYLFIRTREPAGMHIWAEELADSFPWMPDGAIIAGWQKILQLKDADPLLTDKIRYRLLQAVQRGIPIYTEGLRLLYEGLAMLSFEFKREDLEVETAFGRIKAYMAAADLSQETTTFTGTHPAMPGTASNR